MARLGNVFNNKEDIKKEEQHPRRMIKWIHYTKLKENPGQYCPERDKEEIEALADLIEAAGEVIQNLSVSSSYLSKKIRRIKLWQRKSSMEECITQIPQRY